MEHYGDWNVKGELSTNNHLSSPVSNFTRCVINSIGPKGGSTDPSITINGKEYKQGVLSISKEEGELKIDATSTSTESLNTPMIYSAKIQPRGPGEKEEEGDGTLEISATKISSNSITNSDLIKTSRFSCSDDASANSLNTPTIYGTLITPRGTTGGGTGTLTLGGDVKIKGLAESTWTRGTEVSVGNKTASIDWWIEKWNNIIFIFIPTKTYSAYGDVRFTETFTGIEGEEFTAKIGDYIINTKNDSVGSDKLYRITISSSTSSSRTQLVGGSVFWHL